MVWCGCVVILPITDRMRSQQPTKIRPRSRHQNQTYSMKTTVGHLVSKIFHFKTGESDRSLAAGRAPEDCKCASVQVWQVWQLWQLCKCARMQVCKYASEQVCKYASMRVCEYASVQVCKCASITHNSRMPALEILITMTPARSPLLQV